MFEAYQLGGWGMYPVTIVGLVMVAAALVYAARPSRDGRPLVLYLSLLTLISGCLGTVMGFLHTLLAAAAGTAQLSASTLILTGVGESLYCVVQAMIFLFIGIAIACVGAVRVWKKAPAP